MSGGRAEVSAVLFGLKQQVLEAPDDARTYSDLAVALGDLGRDASAFRAFDLALRCDGRNPIILSNLGVCLRRSGAIEKAADCFASALRMQPDFAEARFNLGLLRLAQERFEEGFDLYESRFSMRNSVGLHAKPEVDLWTPGVCVDRLLVVAEQGLGDVLQFVRFLPLLRTWAQRLILVVKSELRPLLLAAGLADQVLTPDAVAGARVDAWIPLMSIPAAVRRAGRVVSLERGMPYLSVEPGLRQTWERQLVRRGVPLIGLCWQGNPEAEQGDFRGRSLELEALLPAVQALPADWLALQKGDGLSQLNDCLFRDRFHSAQPLLSRSSSFLDTAAAACCCDLVVTVDTVVAHLCGALGLPVWLLLPYAPDWRWGLQDGPSSWYPTIRLLRQDKPGNWDTPLARLAAILASAC